MKINAIYYVAAGILFTTIFTQTSMAAESTEELYKQCEAKQTIAEQRACYPMVAKQSEAELIVAEKQARATMVDLERKSEGSRLMQPVKAFDKAERIYRAFRSAESHRVLASYGSGNGGGLASYQTTIEMNIARIKQLKTQ